jgi:8-oxo-dGTP pyrophosphatase MutT (NUDIX family)
MRRPRRWRVRQRERLFDHALFRVERHHLEGEDGARRDALVLDAPHWVNVIPLLGEGDEREVVLVRQWRFAAAASTLEIPGGMVDPGESEEEAARRELLEETGYRARRWRRLGAVDPNPAILTNRCGTWLAEELEKVQEPEGDGDEEIVVEHALLAELPALVARGEITHSLVVAAFYLLGLDQPLGAER